SGVTGLVDSHLGATPDRVLVEPVGQLVAGAEDVLRGCRTFVTSSPGSSLGKTRRRLEPQEGLRQASPTVGEVFLVAHVGHLPRPPRRVLDTTKARHGDARPTSIVDQIA